MTLLGKDKLHEVICERPLADRLIVMPLVDRKQIGESSLDVRLGTTFHLLRRAHESGLDPGEATQRAIERAQEEVVVAFGDRLWLHPGQFVLGATLEYFRFPADLAADVVGRSSWGRLGLLVATAVMVHPGFHGCLTLELVNHGDAPIALYPGSRIAQLAVRTVEGAPADVAHGKYEGATGPRIARLAAERGEIEALRRTAATLDAP